jgi:hypothetical protein
MPFLPFLWASLQTPFLWVSLPQRFHFYGHYLNFEFLFWKHQEEKGLPHQGEEEKKKIQPY